MIQLLGARKAVPFLTSIWIIGTRENDVRRSEFFPKEEERHTGDGNKDLFSAAGPFEKGFPQLLSNLP